MTETFDSWTAYDDWLIQNYDKYAITSLNEKDGKIVAEFMDKSDWEQSQKNKKTVKINQDT